MLRLGVNVLFNTSINLTKVHDSSVHLNQRSLYLRMNPEILGLSVLNHDLQVLFNFLREKCGHVCVNHDLLKWLKSQRVLIKVQDIALFGLQRPVVEQTSS